MPYFAYRLARGRKSGKMVFKSAIDFARFKIKPPLSFFSFAMYPNEPSEMRQYAVRDV